MAAKFPLLYIIYS